MSDSSVVDDPGGPGGGQEAADTTWSSIESMPPWAGLPAEQYALDTGSERPGEARSVLAGLQWPAAGRFGELAGGPPLPGQSTAALTLAPSSGEPLGAGGLQAGPVNQPADNAVL